MRARVRVCVRACVRACTCERKGYVIGAIGMFCIATFLGMPTHALFEDVHCGHVIGATCC